MPNLAFRFAQDNLPSKLLPPLSQCRPGTQSTDKKEACSFAEEVRIGREIGGKESLDVAPVQHQRPLEVGRESLRDGGAALQQIPDPQPGKTSERHLEAACPVNSDPIWILLMPSIPLPEHLACVACFPREAI